MFMPYKWFFLIVILEWKFLNLRSQILARKYLNEKFFTEHNCCFFLKVKCSFQMVKLNTSWNISFWFNKNLSYSFLALFFHLYKTKPNQTSVVCLKKWLDFIFKISYCILFIFEITSTFIPNIYFSNHCYFATAFNIFSLTRPTFVWYKATKVPELKTLCYLLYPITKEGYCLNQPT